MDETEIVEQVVEHPDLVVRTDKFIAYQCAPDAPLIRSASHTREWMDKTHQKFPYRCLPLVIANSFGWDVINPTSFMAVWNGGSLPSDVKIVFPTPGRRSSIPQAHFGTGVLTFTLGHLFRTAPGVNLYVKGPPNVPKDGIVALEGIVETDWSPATFTMNWLFTRKNHEVIFEAGESYCRIFPVPRRITEVFDPELRELDEEPELLEMHMNWRKHRDEFNKGLKVPGSWYVERGWQKDYFQGGGVLFPKQEDHQTKLSQPEFRDCRSSGNAKDILPDESVRPMTLYGKDGRPLTLFVTNLRHDNVKPERSPTHPVMHHRQISKKRHDPAGHAPDPSHPEGTGDGGDNGVGAPEPDGGTGILPD